MRKAAVIGAGIGGIAGALRLAHKGYDVNVFDSTNTTIRAVEGMMTIRPEVTR